jgi:periplasmic copper chaperone A
MSHIKIITQTGRRLPLLSAGLASWPRNYIPNLEHLTFHALLWRRRMTELAPRHLLSDPVRALAVPVVLAGLVALAPPVAAAGDYDIGSIHISQPWSRATPKGAATGAGYMTLTNKGAAPERVSCVSDDASARCQIHSMAMEGGVMKMRPVEDGLEIKPGESVTLKPGGYHIMFMSLKRPLEQGGMVKATLKFDHAGTIDVDYPVLAIGAPAPGASAGGSMMQDSSGAMRMQDGAGGGMMQMDKR